jgi:hypothetical protein
MADAVVPRALRWLGWTLAIVMLLYPADAIHGWYVTKDLVDPTVPPSQTGSALSFGFHVSSMTLIWGSLGWLAFLLCVPWLVVSGSVAVARWRKGRQLDPASRAVLLSVCTAAGLVIAAWQVFAHLLGVLLCPPW